jgi:hypothetical protein
VHISKRSSKNSLKKNLKNSCAQATTSARGYRNGSYARTLATRFGEVADLQVPRTRNNTYATKLFDQYARRAESVNEAIGTLFLNGGLHPEAGKAAIHARRTLNRRAGVGGWSGHPWRGLGGRDPAHLRRVLGASPPPERCLAPQQETVLTYLVSATIGRFVNDWLPVLHGSEEDIHLSSHCLRAKSHGCDFLRHTMATTLLFNGCPIGFIKEILGHDNLETTCQYYLGVDKKAAKEAHRKYLSF